MKINWKKILAVITILVLAVVIVEAWDRLFGIPDVSPQPDPVIQTDPKPADGGGETVVPEDPGQTDEQLPDEHGTYSGKEEVALYIHVYGKLPENFITKKAAEKLGWPGGSLEEYAPGKCIGGGRFYNNEGILPEKDGRKYYECDIDTLGKNSRGAKRIVYSNDGLIYYTGDHYETFELLYGEP